MPAVFPTAAALLDDPETELARVVPSPARRGAWGLTLALALGSAGLPHLAGTWLPGAAVRAQQEPTPIIDPQPQPKPIFLPLTLRSYKASAPDPLDNERTGYLTGLSPSGREACRRPGPTPRPWRCFTQARAPRTWTSSWARPCASRAPCMPPRPAAASSPPG